jgi:hypothetical protein
MKRMTVNFVVFCTSLVLLLSLGTTGIILRYVLPCGEGRRWRGGRGAAESGENINELWTLTRQQWLDVHFWLAVAFAAVIILHIVLHWEWIKCYIKLCLRPAGEK